jgi:imidazolonepropionase-like amidohydrolase
MATTYTAARLYTGETDGLIERGAVTMEGETILYAGGLADAPTASRLVDLGDVTMLPGLIDCHVHLTFSASDKVLEDYYGDSDELKIMRGVENARRALYAGVTTVRECGGQNAHVFALREASRRQLIEAPRIIAAGGSITTTGGHCWFFGLEADSEDDLRRAVRGQVKAGADFIKVMVSGGGLTPRTNPNVSQYTEAQVRAIVEEARRMGLDVSAHSHSSDSITYAARSGARTIEHCSFLTPEGSVYSAEAAQAVIEAGCYVCPTIAIAERAAAALPEGHPMRQAKARMGGKRIENLRRLYELGAKFISGSDAGVTLTPFEDFVFNLTMLVEQVGLNPHAALQTALGQAAEALRQPELGQLAAGKAADLIAVQGNPLEDISALWDVAAVVARGRRYR